jgi:hypothetical protein
MSIQVHDDLMHLFESKGLIPCDRYKKVVADHLHHFLPYGSDVMHGVILTLFQSDKMVAFNLIQNSIDEAKGATRIGIIADRYAHEPLKSKMMTHVSEEMKHSQQFLGLLPMTSCHYVQNEADGQTEEIKGILDFDDDLVGFLCRVHSIEIRSWTVLRYYKQVIRELHKEHLFPALAVLDDIMSDEIGHVLYTGEQINTWMSTNEQLEGMLDACFAHTSKETWVDLSNMTTYLSSNANLIARGMDELDNPEISLGGPEISLLG